MIRLFAALAVSFLLSPGSWSVILPVFTTSESNASVDPWGSNLNSDGGGSADPWGDEEPGSFEPPASLNSEGGLSVDPWGSPGG